MANILSISSEVIKGHVGHAASRFVLQRLGHEVWAFPTVLLSNHPGHKTFSGKKTDRGELEKMRDTLDGNGWLGAVDAVFTGYLPAAEHAEFAVETIALVKSRAPGAKVLCDPALGDDPKGLYIAESAARAIKAKLTALADCLTPNRFELAWLTGIPVTDVESARRSAAALAHPRLFATSIPGPGADMISNLLIEAGEVHRATVKKRHVAPHGTGDMFAALLLGHLLDGKSAPEALALATASVEVVLEESEGADELRLIPTQDLWASPEPWPVERVECPSKSDGNVPALDPEVP